MEAKEYSVIKTKDGRTATVLEVLGGGKDYLVEFSGETGKILGTDIIVSDDIERVVWES